MERAALRAAEARAQAATAPDSLFDVDQVADGIYAAVARPEPVINCNAAIFENANDLLIVDTHSKPSAAAALVAQLRSITSKPVRYVVNTHFHFDHVGGAPQYRKMAPQADFISSTVTRGLIAESAGGRFKQAVEAFRKSADDAERQAAAARTPREREHYLRAAGETRAFLGELQSYSFELPNVTFDENLVIHDKAHELHLAFRGRGHTAGDIVVFCPAKKVLASGDLLHGFLPYIGDGYPREWPRTLRALAEFPFEHVIGGHGGVQHTRERLGQEAAFLEELTEAVASGKAQGRTVEQLQAAITPATLKSLGSGGWGQYIIGQTLEYYWDAVLSTPAELLADGIKGSVAATFNALERT
jgi:glyoxylase-like metal-dependent hydrolase (beta-lactamase superfamily II)